MADDIEEVFCNKCGNTCAPKALKDEGSINNYGLINARFSTGYYSEVLDDGLIYTFSLCEPCVKGLFDSFLVKPHEKEYM